jgi:ArsR family transcriptional regulator
MEVSYRTLVSWLRAAGESSRLRLLALCIQGEPSVSDLAQALGQSEPRVSRHLKILCEAGLIERVRQGQWVHYRLSGLTAAAGFVRGLLGQVERRDAVLSRDRLAVRGAQGSPTRLGRALAEFAAAASSGAPPGALLLIGASHPELLEKFAGAARHATVVTASRRAAQAAAAIASEHGIPLRVLRSLEAARRTAPFDLVMLDHAGGAAPGPERVLSAARSVLSPHGSLLIFECYESFEGARGRVVEHPLARLRRLLGAAGLYCERLSPIEADGEHVLAAAGRLAAAGAEAGGSA